MSACSPCGKSEYSLNDGSGCVECANDTECPCMSGGSCFSKDICYNLGSGNFRCGACPVGFEGDGISCTDIDEVRNKLGRYLFAKHI